MVIMYLTFAGPGLLSDILGSDHGVTTFRMESVVMFMSCDDSKSEMPWLPITHKAWPQRGPPGGLQIN